MLKLDRLSIPLIIFATAICDASSVLAERAIFDRDYQFSCRNLNLQTDIFDSNCDNIFKLYRLRSSSQNQKFIFQDKIKNLNYQKLAVRDTGIADYLVSTVFGIYFPTLETLKPSFGGSFFGGIKLKENINLDTEIVGILEGNTIEKAYFDMSTFLSLRFSLPLSTNNSRSLIYISPGIGISEIDRDYKMDEDEDSRLTWQLEGGVAVPIQNNFGGYGGIKYVAQPSSRPQ